MYIERIRINWDKVSEDSYLTRIPAICLGFDDKGIRYLEYEETESYRITEMMINHRDLMVSQLLPL